MRILHCSDFHANDHCFRWLIKESVKYDLVCLAGDLLDLNAHRAPSAQLDKVLAHLRKIKVPLAVCSGNHDLLDDDDRRLVDAAWLQELRGPNVWIDSDRFTLGGHPFRVLGWLTPLPEASVGEIWLTHCPPDKCPTGIVRGGTGFGDFELGEMCRCHLGPRLALGGHCHDRQKWCAKIGTTWSLNPGRFDGPWPAHIVVDLDLNTATYHGPDAGAGAGPAMINLGPG